MVFSWCKLHFFTESKSDVLRVHPVKTHRTRDGIAPLIYDLASEWSTTRPLTAGERVQVLLEQKADWASEYFLPLLGLVPLIFQPVE